MIVDNGHNNTSNGDESEEPSEYADADCQKATAQLAFAPEDTFHPVDKFQIKDAEQLRSTSTFTLRYYQDLIAAQATKTNTIAYLPTGTGKTFIAFRVIEYRLQFVRISRENPEEWPRVVIFIAPKRALLHQQIQSIRKYCKGVKAEEFDGSTLFDNKKIDQWGLDEWRYHLQRYEVLGMTPATLQALLEKRLLPPTTIDLLVLDECHHATGNDPMAKACDALKLCGLTPLILGLTASPITSKRSGVRKSIELLEARTMCTFFIPTEKYLLNLREFAFRPPVLVVCYNDMSNVILQATQKKRKDLCPENRDSDDGNSPMLLYTQCTGHECFLNAVQSIKALFRRLLCADYIQQIHDLDILLKKDSFKLLCGSLSAPVSEIMHFPGFQYLRECVRQLEEVMTTCGVYFGLQSILFYAQRVRSCFRFKNSNSTEFSSSNSFSNLKDEVENSDAVDIESRDNRNGFPESLSTTNLADTINFCACSRSESRVRFSEEIIEEVDIDENVEALNFYCESGMRDANEGLSDDSNEEYLDDDSIGLCPEDTLLQREMETTILKTNLPSKDSMDIDVDVMGDSHDSGKGVSSGEDITDPLLYRRSLRRLTYHTFDLDKMKNRIPLIVDYIDGDVSYFKFLLDQYFCGMITIIQCLQYLVSICDKQLVFVVVNEYSLRFSILREGTSEVSRESSGRAVCESFLSKIIIQLLKDSLNNKFVSWKEIYDNLSSFSHEAILNEVLEVVTILCQNIPLDSLKEGYSRSVSHNIVEIKSDGINQKNDDMILDDIKSENARYYFFPKIQGLMAVLWTIWNRGNCHDCQNDRHYELTRESKDLKKIECEDWKERFKIALNSKAIDEPEIEELSVLETKTSSVTFPILPMPSTIVFCNKKVMANALSNVVRLLWANHGLVAGVLTGDVAIDQQRKTLQRFRDERIQVLFATEIAEEGLDIKQCSSVVNFDPPGTIKAFIQRRGRARAQNSLNINIWPAKETNEHRFRILCNAMCGFIETEVRFDDQFIAYSTKLLSTQNENSEKYVVSSTGAYVDYVSSQALVFDYCRSLLQRQREKVEDLSLPNNIPSFVEDTTDAALPFYTFESYDDPILDEKVYVTTLHLPAIPSAPAFSWTKSKKQHGKGRAALEAVQYLHQNGILDDHLRVIEFLREISPFESLPGEQKRKKQSIIDDETADDSNNDKVDLAVKAVSDELCITPQFEAGHTCLHFYSIHCDLNSARLKNLSTVMQDSLNTLQYLTFAVASIQEVRIAENVWKGSFQESFQNQLPWIFQYLGARTCSDEEIGLMQAYHLAVLTTRVPHLPEIYRDEHGFVNPLLFASSDKRKDVLRWFPYHEPDIWVKSSNHAWYIAAPISCFQVSHMCDHQINKYFDPETLFQEALMAVTLMNNLHVIKANNSMSTPPPFDFVSAENYCDMKDWICTSNACNLIRLNPQLPCPNSLLDIMDIKKKLTFHEYLSKRGPRSAAWIDKQLLLISNTEHINSSRMQVKDNESLADTTASLSQLVFIDAISSKLTHSNFIGNLSQSHSAAQKNGSKKKVTSNTKKRRPACIMPQLCFRLGKSRHFYHCLLLPGLVYRFLSVCLARELRATLQHRLLSVMGEERIEENISGESDAVVSAPTNPILQCKLQLSDVENKTPNLAALLEAMTATRAMEGLQSERLEFLGDSFLKLAASLEVFTNFHQAAEGELTQRRRNIICNRSLTQLAVKTEMAQFVRVLPFSRGLEAVYLRPPGLSIGDESNEDNGIHNWLPSLRNCNLQAVEEFPKVPSNFSTVDVSTVKIADDLLIAEAFHESNSQNQRQLVRQLPSKVLADLMEALLGVFVSQSPLHFGLQSAALLAYGLQIINHNCIALLHNASPTERETLFNFPMQTSLTTVLSPHPNQLQFNSPTDFAAISNAPLQLNRICLPLKCTTLQKIEHQLQYHFQCPNLLAVAFTHASMSYEYQSYERLEFLGDAVLDFLVARILYHLHPQWKEGHLSQSKHDHSSNKYLSGFGEKLGVLQLVRHNSGAILRALKYLESREKPKIAEAVVQNSTHPSEQECSWTLHGSFAVDDTTTEFVCSEILSAVHPSTFVDHVEATEIPSNVADLIDLDCNEFQQIDTMCPNEVAIPESMVKIQADIIEAIIGAVYLDTGGDIDRVETMLRHLSFFGESMLIKPQFTANEEAVPDRPSSPEEKKSTAIAASSADGNIMNQCFDRKRKFSEIGGEQSIPKEIDMNEYNINSMDSIDQELIANAHNRDDAICGEGSVVMMDVDGINRTIIIEGDDIQEHKKLKKN